MGLFDIFKRKDNGSVDEQMRREAEAQMQKVELDQSVANSVSGDFVMEVEDVFHITGRGTVVTGRVQSGKVNLNDIVIIRQTGMSTKVVGIEQFRKNLDYAQAGDTVGILLANVSKDDVPRGTTLIK